MSFILNNSQYEHINNTYTSILSNEIKETDYKELSILELLQVKSKLVDKLNAFGVIDVTTLKREIVKIEKNICDKFSNITTLYVVYNNITDYPFLSYDNRIYVATEENIATALLGEMKNKVAEIRIEEINNVTDYLKSLYHYNGIIGFVVNTCEDANKNSKVDIADIIKDIDKIRTFNNKEITNTYLHLSQLAQLNIDKDVDKCLDTLRYAISQATFIVPVISDNGEDISQISVPLMDLDNEDTVAIAVYTDESSYNAIPENKKYVKYLLTYKEIVTYFKSNIVINPRLLWIIVDSGFKAKINEMNRA